MEFEALKLEAAARELAKEKIMEKVAIEARNNLNIPVRLTAVNVGGGHEESRILITIGAEGASLKTYFRSCIDTDIPPGNEWQEIGALTIESRSIVSLNGLMQKELNDFWDNGE